MAENGIKKVRTLLAMLPKSMTTITAEREEEYQRKQRQAADLEDEERRNGVEGDEIGKKWNDTFK